MIEREEYKKVVADKPKEETEWYVEAIKDLNTKIEIAHQDFAFPEFEKYAVMHEKLQEMLREGPIKAANLSPVAA